MNCKTMKNETISGWLNINKEPNISSAQVVNMVKRITKVKKAGHAGTLDPLASGVLPIAIGSATKTVRYMMNSVKTYEFIINWGYGTDTDDKEGKIIAQSMKRPSKENIIKSLAKFEGNIFQIPPNYSAIKIDGVRSYKLARQSKETKLPVRKVKVEKLELLEYINPDYSKFYLKCEKGVYVRSIARDLAKLLGTYGHVSKLCRLSVNNFYYKDAILLADLSKLVDKSSMSRCIHPISVVLDDIPAIDLDEHKANLLSNGQKVLFSEDGLDKVEIIEEVYITCANNPWAIAKYEKGFLLPRKIF